MKRSAVIASMALLSVVGSTAPAADPHRRPNIVFILLDNVGREWFGCYGSEEHCTPNIDKLAATGVRFENCYTPTVCGPSRVELLTGRYPFHTGWYLHHDAALYGGGGLDWHREITFARVLRNSGYATGIAGKWQVNNLYDEPDALREHGFGEHLIWPGSIDRDKVSPEFLKGFQAHIASQDSGLLMKENREIESRYWDPVLIHNGKRETHPGEFGPDHFQKFALDYIRRHAADPFLLYYPMVLTHGVNFTTPTVPTPDNQKAPPEDEKQRFAAMLRYADRQVGEVIQALEAAGLRDHTYVFVASDNGTEKSLTARCQGREVHGGLYQINEAGGSVVLTANAPKRIPGGRTAPLADFTDVFPTICELTGVTPPSEAKIDGLSFAGFLHGTSPAPRQWIFNEYLPDRVIRDAQFKLYSDGRFFDVTLDPDETHPLVPGKESTAARSKEKLQSLLDSLPADTPLPFPHRSLSAFKLRMGKSDGKPWRTLPLITDGKIDSAWAQVGWGGFVVDDGTLRAEPDDRGMGLLLYMAEKFGQCRIRVVYRCVGPKTNSGIYVRMDDGILSRIGEKSPEVHRDQMGKLSPDMIKRLEEASEKHLGAWYPVHHGYEVQIMDASDAFHRTGAIYSLAEAKPVPKRDQHEWRTMIITLDGERIRVEVDGTLLSQFDASTPPTERKKWTEPIRDIKRPTVGYIGLQNHDPGDIVWFKEISVQSLEKD